MYIVHLRAKLIMHIFHSFYNPCDSPSYIKNLYIEHAAMVPVNFVFYKNMQQQQCQTSLTIKMVVCGYTVVRSQSWGSTKPNLHNVKMN